MECQKIKSTYSTSVFTGGSHILTIVRDVQHYVEHTGSLRESKARFLYKRPSPKGEHATSPYRKVSFERSVR